jgi:gamma-glutamylcyclotransferase (GGCT)/AIG2-like uncharacterized protein YtfP
MCVIIIKNSRKKLEPEILKKSARINPHGLGIVWLDTYKITYHKSSEYTILTKTNRPYIAHFRFATIGKIGKSNTHPFQCGAKEHEYLMMNGTIKGLGDINNSDTKVLAEQLGTLPRHTWKDKLKEFACRFVSINTRNKTFQQYNKELWVQRDGVWYSKDNVLEDNLVAVYGTLKKGYSNYWHYLYDSTHVGRGTTKDKYPLLVKGLPYLIEEKGKGHNVDVDVFRVSDGVLRNLDGLEGHPNWYRRKQISINVGGVVLKCWIYFNIRERVHPSDKLHKSYKQSASRRSYFEDIDWSGWDKTAVSKKETTDACECELPKSSYLPTKRSYYFEDRLFTQEEEKEFDVANEKPICPKCYHDLEHDAYGNYHCMGCDGWFSENELNKDNLLF